MERFILVLMMVIATMGTVKTGVATSPSDFLVKKYFSRIGEDSNLLIGVLVNSVSGKGTPFGVVARGGSPDSLIETYNFPHGPGRTLIIPGEKQFDPESDVLLLFFSGGENELPRLVGELCYIREGWVLKGCPDQIPPNLTFNPSFGRKSSTPEDGP